MNRASRRGRRSALRYGRWLTWLITGPLLIVFATYVALPVGLAWYLPELAKRYGMHLSVQRVRVEPFASRLRLHGVRIGNAGDTGSEWASVEARVDLVALLSGRIVLDDFRMSEAILFDGGTWAGTVGADPDAMPGALAEDLDVGEFTIESVELAGISKALGRPVTIDRLRLESLVALFRPEGTAVHAELSIGEGRSRVDGRLTSNASSWILDAEIGTEAVALDGFPALLGIDSRWRGRLEGSGPVRFVYSPADDAFSATTGGRWAVDRLEVGFGDTGTARARVDAEGTVFIVLLGDVLDTLSVDAALDLQGLGVEVADGFEAEAAALTLQIDASQALATRMSIRGSSPEVRLRGRGGAFDAKAGQIAAHIALSFTHGAAIEVDRFESGTFAVQTQAGSSIDVNRLALERVVVDTDAFALSAASATARRMDWRDSATPQSAGTAAGITLRGLERSADGSLRLARVSLDTVESAGAGPGLRMRDVVLDATTLSPSGRLAFGGLQASDAWLTSRESTLVLERLSLDGIERESDGGAVSVESGRAAIVDHALAAGRAMVGKDVELAGARVLGESWEAARIRFSRLDLATGEASYAMSEFVLADAAGEGSAGSARQARLGGFERWFGGNRIVGEDLSADSPAWKQGAGKARTIGFASLTMDVVGRCRWQVSGGRVAEVEMEASGAARAGSASIENLGMSVAGESIIGLRDVELEGLTSNGASTVQASSATAGRARFQVHADASVDATGLSADALEWNGEMLAAERGGAPLMSVGAASVRASLDAVEFTSARLGADGLRQLESLSAASFRGGIASSSPMQWTAGRSKVSGYRASSSGAATLDLMEMRDVELIAGAHDARLRADRVSAREARLESSGAGTLASAVVDGATLESRNASRVSVRALEGSRVALHDSGLEIGSLDLSGLDGTVGSTEQGEWSLPLLPVGGGDATSPFSVRIEEIRTADAESFIRIVDGTTDPDFTARIDIASATLRGFDSGSTGSPARFSVEGTAQAVASVQASGALMPTLTGIDLDLNVQLRGLSLPALSPYSRLHLGQDVAAGHADVTLELAVRSSDIDGVVDFSTDGLLLGSAATPVDRSVPGAVPGAELGPALALIEERRGAIELKARLRGSVDDPEFDFDRLLTRVLADSALGAAEQLRKDP